MRAIFSLEGVDVDDVETVEHHWNNWVRALFSQGYRPGEEPVAWTDESMTYELYRLGSPQDVSGYALAAGEAAAPAAVA